MRSARSWRRLRLVALAIGAASMALGLWTGLERLGLSLPSHSFAGSELHGPLMIGGFLGTVISLERAVALGRWWAYAAPALSGLGALALFASLPGIGALAFIAAAAVLFLTSAVIAARQAALFTLVLAVAAACWAIGTWLWLSGEPVPMAVGWWLNFLILTIAAERLELSRMVRPPRSSQVAFAVFALLLVVGSARGELAEGWAPFTAAGLLGSAAWLLHYDVARRTVRQNGLPRFSAAAILAGHVWLAAAGALILLARIGTSAFSYDAVVHAIALGFVLSMIFGHAPIILPAVTGLRVQFSALAYAPLALLHLAVALRIGGDLLEWQNVRVISGLLTVVALVTYAGTLVAASLAKSGRAARP